tara:strand:- start:335 stop:580 length:246 start_codon:yes stop_codon:yes gene_type:complete
MMSPGLVALNPLLLVVLNAMREPSLETQGLIKLIFSTLFGAKDCPEDSRRSTFNSKRLRPPEMSDNKTDPVKDPDTKRELL